ncbi:nuclear transport factor 2 family protein [Sphingobacterium sp. SRCM116780]|uniref:nuclear transport factor 2 family protein n=1 Tax=Sphingobacterium sp. SRCM116780 TaxID=2907623 RepID=UPI001F3E5887|nr:nuclear transport factor 2 family protein [Sphingobacterium sp. SRCM116780]UIR54844.1 nuclear transport factor 2 family protein [Sphingobacterium sp. SRCM116780]
MKTLVKTFTAAALIAISTCTIAAVKPEKGIINLSTADYAIDNYIAVMTEGQSAGVEQLFATDFSQKVQGIDTLLNHSRSEVIDLLKKQKGEKLNCETSIKIIEESAQYRVARVTMKFTDFTKTDLITLINEGGIWKVSSSVNSYQ